MYIAIITLTAPENYEFTAAFKASLNGENLSVSGSGNTVTITKTFPATENRVLESIQVTKQPNKTRYSIGDRFDSTGMVVTATYDDGNSEEVTGSQRNAGSDDGGYYCSYHKLWRKIRYGCC